MTFSWEQPRVSFVAGSRGVFHYYFVVFFSFWGAPKCLLASKRLETPSSVHLFHLNRCPDSSQLSGVFCSDWFQRLAPDASCGTNQLYNFCPLGGLKLNQNTKKIRFLHPLCVLLPLDLSTQRRFFGFVLGWRFFSERPYTWKLHFARP